MTLYLVTHLFLWIVCSETGGREACFCSRRNLRLHFGCKQSTVGLYLELATSLAHGEDAQSHRSPLTLQSTVSWQNISQLQCRGFLCSSSYGFKSCRWDGWVGWQLTIPPWSPHSFETWAASSESSCKFTLQVCHTLFSYIHHKHFR